MRPKQKKQKPHESGKFLNKLAPGLLVFDDNSRKNIKCQKINVIQKPAQRASIISEFQCPLSHLKVPESAALASYPNLPNGA